MLINTKDLREVDKVGKTIKKNIEEYYKNKSLIKRILGI